MFKIVSQLYNKYQQVIAYLFWGVMTTLVNLICYFGIRYFVPNLNPLIVNIIAWFFSVLFAYVTNRTLVFHSQNSGRQAIIKEAISFFIARLISLIPDELIMLIGINLLGINDGIVKFIAQIVVIVLNYVLSKFIIFRNREKESNR